MGRGVRARAGGRRREAHRGRYVPGERGWIKTKNRDYWRYEMEREGAMKLRAKQFV